MAAAARERTPKPRSKTALKTEFVRARIDPKTKLEAEAVLGAVGLSLSDAFRMMIVRTVHDRRLPFQPLIPNEETIAALRADISGRVIEVGHPSNLWATIDAD